MTQITIDKNILLVEVPVNASDPWVINNGQESVGLNWYEPNKSFGEEGLTYSTGGKLPAGNWQFIGTTDEVTQMIANKCFPNYGGSHKVKNFHYQMKRNGVPSDKRFAILKLNP